MKKTFIYFFAVLICMQITSCKKGEDDPQVSLKSRKARLERAWKLTEGTMTLGIRFSDKTTVEGIRYIFTKDKFTRDDVGRGAHFEGPFNLDLNIEKNREFGFDQTIDGKRIKAMGSWNFMKKSKDHKNKEAIFVSLNTISGFSAYFFTFNKSLGAFQYRIKELKNKKLVLIADDEMLDFDKNGDGI